MGGMNYHIPIHFVDGVTWLCRIRRRNITTAPVDHQNRSILSEVATCQFLSSRTLIPVPKVHDYSIDSPFNFIGAGYILMDKLVGKPLSHCDLTDADREHVLSQLADVFSALKQHPFNKIGCLSDPDNLSVGPVTPVLDESTIDADEDGNLLFLGPFRFALEYRTTSIKHQIELILRGESYSNNAIDAYLIHRFVLDYVITENEHGSFFLKHIDDKGDHILVDDEFCIVGIIDWEWVQITTQSEAFAAPIYLLDIGLCYSGSNELSREEVECASVLKRRNEAGLAEYVYGGRVGHRLAHCVGGDSGDIEDLQNHFMGLRRAVLLCHNERETWAQWREGALMTYEKDEDLQNLILKGSK